MTLDNLLESNFMAPDVVLDCTNVQTQIQSMQERMMTVRLNEQGQRDYDAWLQRANQIKADCDKPKTDVTPVVKKNTSLQPILTLLGVSVAVVVIYKLLK